MEKKSYKMHEDEQKFRRCMEKESEELVVKMNTSYEMHCVINECELQDAVCCVLKCLNNKVVPEIHFVALLKLKAPARAISVESTLALNPWCFGAKVVYVHTPGTHPPQCKAIHDSLSVLPNLEKSQETCSNTLQPVNYCPTARTCTPLMQVPHVPKGTQEHMALA
jgi:hypothetical protein